MTRKNTQYEQLDRLEADFITELSAALTLTASGGFDIFLSARGAEVLPPRYVAALEREPGERLVRLGEELIALRERLGESVDGSPADLFRKACARWADHADANRPGPKKLAQQLLDALDGR